MRLKAVVVIAVLFVGALLTWPLIKTIAGGPEVPGLVPLPEKLVRLRGAFSLEPKTRIAADPSLLAEAQYLARELRRGTGYELPLRSEGSRETEHVILLTSGAAPAAVGNEGYRMIVSDTSVVIHASHPAGAFYGAQTLLQLLPPGVISGKLPQRPSWSVPCVEIEDRPRFPWRGFMLDVSRHFFSVSEIERLLDLMALHKLNTFHWHLTDDQGWRIDIPRYPRLTQVGAWRARIGFGLDPKTSTAWGPDGRYGGYYTQEDIKRVVAYAQARHITIVPEIEMPGHSTAALQAYPEFACQVPHDPTRPPDVFCAGNDGTFEFLQNILEEVCRLFPGQYVHIGCDEVSKLSWMDCRLCQGRIKDEGLSGPEGLQAYFAKRIEKFLSSKGRTALGWSEIQKAGLPDGIGLMDWIGGGAEAAAQGHPVVMTPQAYCYFDLYQSQDRIGEPSASGAFLPLEKVYAFEPIPAGLDQRFWTNILGGQGNLWTEYIPSWSQAEYMTFPRLSAMAEVLWSPRDLRDPGSFQKRLKIHLRRLDGLGVNYRRRNEMFQ
jgi:hexosaminidase